MACACISRLPRAAATAVRSLSVAGLAVGLLHSSPLRAQQVVFEERLLATIPKGLDVYFERYLTPVDPVAGIGLGDRWQVRFSDDGSRVGYLARRDRKAVAVVGDSAGPPFDAIYDLTFSPDGRRFAYVGRVGKKAEESTWSMVVDHVPGPQFEHVGYPVITPDGQHVLYAATRTQNGSTRALLVRDHQVVSEHDWLGDIGMSPDGKTLAYVEGRRVGDSIMRFMVSGATRGAEYLYVGMPTWSTDGAHFGFIAQEREVGPVKVVVDGSVVLEVPSVAGLRLIGSLPVVLASAKGASYRGLHASTADGYRLHLGGSPGVAYDEVGLPAVSADGRHIAYGAKNLPKGMRGRTAYLVIDSLPEQLNKNQWIGNAFDPYVPSHAPGSNLSYLQVGTFALQSATPGTSVVFVGEHAYFGHRDNLFLRLASARRLALTPLTFSPDGKTIAYTKWTEVRVGDKKSDRFDWTGPPVFSADGTKIAFGARKGRELWWKVMEVNP